MYMRYKNAQCSVDLVYNWNISYLTKREIEKQAGYDEDTTDNLLWISVICIIL